MNGVGDELRRIITQDRPQRIVIGAHTDQQERIYRAMLERADLQGYQLSREMSQGGPMLVLTRADDVVTNGIGGMRRKDVMRDVMRDSQGAPVEGAPRPARMPDPQAATPRGANDLYKLLAAMGIGGGTVAAGIGHMTQPRATTAPQEQQSNPLVEGILRSSEGPSAPSLKPRLDGAIESVDQRAGTDAKSAESQRRQEFYSWLRSNGDPGSGVLWNQVHQKRAGELKVTPEDRRRGVRAKRLVYGYDIPLSELENAPVEELINGEWVPVQ